MRSSFLIVSFSLVCCLAIGCEQPSSTAGDNLTQELEEHKHGGHQGHDHGDHSGHDHEGHDDHAEEMGPNKGHIIHLEPSDYVAEWRHYKGNSIIRVYVLDAQKKSTAVQADVSIKSTSGKTPTTFELAPEDADAQGKTAVYMLDDQALSVAMNLGVELTIEIDGKSYVGKVDEHAPHHH